jgi:hypothetical protein
MNSLSSVLSESYTKFPLVPNRFTYVGGQSWCLILFCIWEKVHKRGKVTIFNWPLLSSWNSELGKGIVVGKVLRRRSHIVTPKLI